MALLQLRVKPVAKERTLKLLPLMRLRVLRVAQIVPPGVRHLQRAVLHRRVILQPPAHRVLLDESIRQVLRLLPLANVLHVLLGNLPLVVLLVEPTRATIVEQENFKLALLQVNALIVKRVVTPTPLQSMLQLVH